MIVLQRGMVVVGVFFMIFGICRQGQKRSHHFSTISPQKQFLITNPNHPYWRHRMPQYWNYDLN